MFKAETSLCAGDWIEVKTPAEVAETLDANGVLDGLPFMPEMAQFCGRRFRVLRKAEKTCLETDGGAYLIREFLHNDVVLLEGLRCAGDSHDGCQRLCTLLWKSAWLRKLTTENLRSEKAEKIEVTYEDFPFQLKTKISPERYFCQSTELAKATRERPLTRVEILIKCYREVRSGAVGVLEMASLVLVPLYRKVRDRLVGRPRLVGTLTRTPVGTLGLQPGELVEIKSLEEMRETLDRNGRNRGLVCDIELKKFCGQRYRVRGRLDRMISEATGQMRRVEGTVVLDGNTCMCARALGGCPRLEFCYWREVWLKRVEEPMTQPEEHCISSGAQR